MDRQLSVWAATGLVVLATLLGLLFGHLPGGGIEVGQRWMPPLEPQPAPAAPPTTTVPAASSPAPTPAEPAVSVDDGDASVPADAEVAEESVEAADASAEPADGGSPGVVQGRIVLDGKAPAARPPVSVPASQLEECCGDAMPTEDRTLRVSPDGGVADAVVIVKAAGAPAEGAGRVVEMDQRCCRFEPRVVLVPVGAELRYLNSDETTHNVHTYAKKNQNLNNNVAGGSSIPMGIARDERFEVKCDIHTWMKAHVVATEHATAAVTAADGTFRIEGVPPGKHAVEIWSEGAKAAQGRLSVEVEPGGETTVEWRVEAR